MKNLLQTSLQPLYTELLAKLTSTENLYPFCMQWGKYFPKEKQTGILFVGKATNGWHFPTRDINQIFPEHGEGIFNRDDQMRWVLIKPYYSVSAFWRVIKKVSEKVSGSGEWYDNVAWSNLYKLSYNHGNPKGRLIREQKELCVEILKAEIRVLSPKFVVFLTSGWEDFFFSTQNSSVQEWQKITWSNRYPIKFAEFEGVTYIRSVHPQGKPETEHINIISDIIKSKLC